LDWSSQVDLIDENGLTGVIDLINGNSEIYEIKLARVMSKQYIMQALIYTFLHRVSSKSPLLYNNSYKFCLLNILSGILIKYDIQISSEVLKKFIDSNLLKLYKIPQYPIYLYSL
jgi:hypothetical protein